MISTEEFIERARKVHGDKYDYSKVEYKHSKEKICIICPEHGEFWQTPNSHLMGHGCKLCKANNSKELLAKTLKDFIDEYTNKFGYKYNFNKSIYKNANTKMIVTCKKHGDFLITPNHLLNGHGCKKCGIENGHKKQSLGTEEFIRRAKKVHGSKYDYSKVNYISRNEKICIICPEHGEFWQMPSLHLDGFGCSKCSGKYNYSTEEWIDKARHVHGNTYDYSDTNYVNYWTKVKIICKKHGEFFQYPGDHLKGCGCPSCNASKLEADIMVKLKENNINFVHIARNNILPWLGKQSLDFYLPDYNIAIECQGKQHFKPVDFAGKGEEWALENFNYIRKLDKNKKELCEANNVELLFYEGSNSKNIIEEIRCHRKK